MSVNELDEYWVPEHVKDYLRKLGFVLPLDDMEPWIRSWDDWMGARGDFYDYRDKDGMGRVYEVHRRSIHPAMRVCKEWGSLLLNEEVKVVCEDQKATEWIDGFFSNTGFMAQAQDTVVRAFGLGTGAWALWLDLDRKKVRIRHYDARMVIPLTWDEDGVTFLLRAGLDIRADLLYARFDASYIGEIYDEDDGGQFLLSGDVGFHLVPQVRLDFFGHYFTEYKSFYVGIGATVAF